MFVIVNRFLHLYLTANTNDITFLFDPMLTDTGHRSDHIHIHCFVVEWRLLSAKKEFQVITGIAGVAMVKNESVLSGWGGRDVIWIVTFWGQNGEVTWCFSGESIWRFVTCRNYFNRKRMMNSWRWTEIQPSVLFHYIEMFLHVMNRLCVSIYKFISFEWWCAM